MNGNNPFQPEYLILHDYGGSPGATPSFNPYHTLVSGGRVNYRDAKNPYGKPAPHAYKLNPKSIGLSWGGKVGGMPSKEEFALIKQEYDAIKKQFPNIKVMSHGEAYQQTRGTGQQASRAGRGLEEASWRKFLQGDVPYEPGTVTPAGPTPMGQRSLTAYAGVSKTQPPTTGEPQPMPAYQDVGGQAPVMDPAEVARRQQMAKMLMQNGQDTGNMRHWTQALGAVLNSGAGVYQGKQAAEGLAKGQQSGNDALAQLLMGGDASAAVSNPYSSERALKYEMDKKTSGADYGKAGTLFQNPETGEYEAVQFGSDGTIKRTPMSGMTPFKGVGEVDTGTGTEVINKATGETVRSIGKKLFEAERQKGLGDAQAKGEVSWPKVEMGYEQAKLQDQYVVEDIDQALTQAGPWTTGFAGSVGKFVAGSPQSDLAFTLEGIKANLGFDKLQAIRDASPTGGALGAVTERELDLLQSAWGSIAQAQSEEQFKQRLTRLKQIKAQYATLKQRAYEQDKQRFGAAAVPNPQGGQALDPSALQGRGNQPLLAPQGGAPAAPGWSLKRL